MAHALELASHDARLAFESLEPEGAGVILGMAFPGQLGMIEFATRVRAEGPRFVSPKSFPQTVGNYTASALARAFDLRGPNLTVSCGLTSSLVALIEGYGLVSSGAAGVLFAGGAERLSDELASDLARPGVELSEGACLFVLEPCSRASARGVVPLATLLVLDRGCDAAALAGRSDVILSTCSEPFAGAVFIERWVGRCPGAAGAAAAAAAIGAAWGLGVPDHPPGTRAAGDGSVRAVVFAGGAGPPGAAIELTVRPRP